jgi:hypothetical protein
MESEDQVPPPASPSPDDPLAGEAPAAPVSAPDPLPYEPPAPPAPRIGERGLRGWFAIVVAAGIAGALLGQVELAALALVGGLFAVTHAVDLDRRWRDLHDALAWIVPVASCATFFTTAAALVSFEGAGAAHLALAFFSVAAGGTCIVLFHPAVIDRLSRWWFRGSPPSHTIRLASRLVFAGLLFAPPGWLLFQSYRDVLFADESLVGPSELWGGLVGLILVSLGGIGFMVRRGARESAARLGITPLLPRDYVIVVLGVIALYAVNVGFEFVQRAWFPGTFASDQAVTGLIAGNLSGIDALLLGISAGVGEEVALRGALLPPLGLLWSSMLFAALHVQYSWVGMLAILTLGLLLGFIRQRSSTTTAMAVHAIYDVLAVISAQQAVT